MEQLEIFPRRDETKASPRIPEATMRAVLRSMAQLLLDLVQEQASRDAWGADEQDS
jgi:hypothetical protein